MAEQQNTEITDTDNSPMVMLAADVVSAYVSNNPVPVGELPSLISQVFASLSNLQGAGAEPAEKVKLSPAVSVKKSVSEDNITCLDCGKRFKSLKRHIQSNHGMTPEEYRAHWGLEASYPMVAPKYAEARSSLAKKMGLGRKPKSVEPETKNVEQAA